MASSRDSNNVIRTCTLLTPSQFLILLCCLHSQIDYSVYGTPIENTTEKFAKCLQRRFGTIPGITDRNYVTNSYHVPVFEQIDAFKKIDVEAELQKLSPGGAISYIETPNMENNVEAILSVIKYIYDNIMYCEINRTT